MVETIEHYHNYLTGNIFIDFCLALEYALPKIDCLLIGLIVFMTLLKLCS